MRLSEFNNTNSWTKVSRICLSANSMEVTKADPDQTRQNMRVNFRLSNQTMGNTKLDRLLSQIASLETLYLSSETCLSNPRKVTIAICALSVIFGGKKLRCTTKRLTYIWRQFRNLRTALHSSRANQWWVLSHWRNAASPRRNLWKLPSADSLIQSAKADPLVRADQPAGQLVKINQLVDLQVDH